MKLLGIDYGTKRVGIAVSDESGSVAFPKAVYPNNKHLLSDVVSLIQKEGVVGVVVGESKNMHGEDNAVMEGARHFADMVGRETQLPVHFEKEFFSSYEARKTLDDKNKTVDAEAAAIILNRFILKTKK